MAIDMVEHEGDASRDLHRVLAQFGNGRDADSRGIVTVTRRGGMTLLEVLVALVILTMVGASYLELFSQSQRLVGGARQWSDAVSYAQDAMELVKLGRQPDPLPNGFRTQVTRRPWSSGYSVVTVTVFLPSGQRFDLDRLTKPDARGTDTW
jgi:prepilin-type N-terminal cleavage/methylation domain-containing protein